MSIVKEVVNWDACVGLCFKQKKWYLDVVWGGGEGGRDEFNYENTSECSGGGNADDFNNYDYNDDFDDDDDENKDEDNDDYDDDDDFDHGRVINMCCYQITKTVKRI